MMSRRLPPWKRWIGIATAALMLMLSLGPSVVLAASALAEGVTEADASSEQEPQEQLTIGVIELVANGVEDTEARAITDRLRTWLGRTGAFQVIERNRMVEIMEEMGFQESGACNTDECVVQVGQVLGASKMIAGSVSKVGSLYSLQIRMIDIATSRIEHPLFEDVNGIESVLQDVTQNLANQMAALVRQQMGVPFQPIDPEEQARQQEQTDPVVDPARQQEDPVDPPVTGEQPGGEDEQPATPRTRKKFPWWLLLLGAVGGGSAYLLSGDDGGPDPVNTIGSPPNRPTIPPG
ncbi:CsgG/HfaB family protein [Gemmatimonadota bacterium]